MFLKIPEDIAKTADPQHIDNLYRVCRFCHKRVTLSRGKPAGSPGEKTCHRAGRFYNIDFKREVTNILLPKVLCKGCTRRLTRFDSQPDTYEAWNRDERCFLDALAFDTDGVATRSEACTEEAPCKVCQIVSNRESNELQAKRSNARKAGRPLEQSPPKPICKKCGLDWFDHDSVTCRRVMKRPSNAALAGRLFGERVAARGFTKQLVQEHLRDQFTSEAGGSSCSTTPQRSGVKLSSHEYLGITPARYDNSAPGLYISTDSARDLLRLGHLGLGKSSARRLCSILAREGIYFPNGGLEACRSEQWVVFGRLFRSEHLLLDTDRQGAASPTPFGLCTDVGELLNIVTDGDADSVSRLKFQFDGGRQFLKLSVNIVSIEEKCPYVLSPNSVLKNFVVGLGQAKETQANLRVLFGYPSIKSLFDMQMRKQIACDLKVAAMIVGIQPASCKHPCPFCLWSKGTPCTGQPSDARTWAVHQHHLANREYNVVYEPSVQWDTSPMEVLSLAPLHLLLGITNKVFKEVFDLESDSSFAKKQKAALLKYGIKRSAYFQGDLQGNECARLLDAVADNQIPFPRGKQMRSKVKCLQCLKVVKDKCLGLVRVDGWDQAIQDFRKAWKASGLSWTLKVHILCDHGIEYLRDFETDNTAGLGLSSEQSGESLHARLQRIWDMRFRVNPENVLFGSRLTDCMVAYNWSLQWDEAGRLRRSGQQASGSDGNTTSSNEVSGTEHLSELS